MSALTLSPVSAGIYAALNVSAVTSLASGPFDTEVAQNTAFPYVWFAANEDNARGLGRGGLRKVSFRVHVAGTGSATAGPAKQVQTIAAAIVNLLEDATLTIAGYRQAGEVFYDGMTEPFASEIGGQACWETLANFYLWVEP